MLWALTDLLVQFLAFVDKDQTIDATLIVSYILGPSVGSFLTIGILLIGFCYAVESFFLGAFVLENTGYWCRTWH